MYTGDRKNEPLTKNFRLAPGRVVSPGLTYGYIEDLVDDVLKSTILFNSTLVFWSKYNYD